VAEDRNLDEFDRERYRVQSDLELALTKEAREREHQRLRLLAYLNAGAAAAFLAFSAAPWNAPSEAGWTRVPPIAWAAGFFCAWLAWTFSHYASVNLSIGFRKRRQVEGMRHPELRRYTEEEVASEGYARSREPGTEDAPSRATSLELHLRQEAEESQRRGRFRERNAQYLSFCSLLCFVGGIPFAGFALSPRKTGASVSGSVKPEPAVVLIGHSSPPSAPPRQQQRSPAAVLNSVLAAWERSDPHRQVSKGSLLDILDALAHAGLFSVEEVAKSKGKVEDFFTEFAKGTANKGTEAAIDIVKKQIEKWLDHEPKDHGAAATPPPPSAGSQIVVNCSRAKPPSSAPHATTSAALPCPDCKCAQVLTSDSCSACKCNPAEVLGAPSPSVPEQPPRQ
jgi:hypothetical protein